MRPLASTKNGAAAEAGLEPAFFERSVHEVARDLIGCTVVHGSTSGVIVEVESYHADDAACHAFGVPATSVPALFPYGIYSIPEISMVGRTEEDLTQDGVPYEVGKAHYREIARGQIIGDTTGMLKLIFHLDTHELLGVHIIGEGASELIHIGQAVLSFGGRIEYFVNTVFNYPTLAECYKTAAFDGVNRLGLAPTETLSVPGAAA